MNAIESWNKTHGEKDLDELQWRYQKRQEGRGDINLFGYSLEQAASILEANGKITAAISEELEWVSEESAEAALRQWQEDYIKRNLIAIDAIRHCRRRVPWNGRRCRK